MRLLVASSRPLAMLMLLIPMVMASGAAHGSEGGWTPLGPAGNIRTMAVSGADGQLVYAVGDKGFWRSNDGGRSWSLRSQQKLSSTSPILADQHNPEIVYGSGAEDLRGILKSTDGGFTWTALWPDVDVTVFAASTAVPGTIFAAATTLRGATQILRSMDGGTTWAVMSDFATADHRTAFVSALAVSPAGNEELYAVVQFFWDGDMMNSPTAGAPLAGGTGVLMRSEDGGAHWAEIRNATLDPTLIPTTLVITASSGAIRVYVAWAGAGWKTISMSSDHGDTWQDLSIQLPPAGNRITSLIAAGRGELYAGITGTNPKTGEGGGVYLSRDAGESWQQLESLAVGINELVLGSTDGPLLAATIDGVWSYALARANVEPVVHKRFIGYYDSHDGQRILGSPIAFGANIGSILTQYFEKGRIEDHSQETADPVWQFMFGLLVDEMQRAGVAQPVGGASSTATYATIKNLAAENLRVPPPPGYTTGTMQRFDGSRFVPFAADLSAAPGHDVYGLFWDYLNRKDLFPAGWLHDIGLPITEPLRSVVNKGNASTPVYREIIIQAFQRTILTYDPLNPPDWKVERANAGTDYANAFPDKVPR
ncbi:MAG: sialidase family protein [Dehalococcoidia bacterium]|nr:sialidase family protein [Dehalococcoidia bacterium]